MEKKISRIAIFAHFDRDALIDPYVVYYLEALSNVAEHIIFVSDCDINASELNKIENLVSHTICQRHGEYDFGSYKRGYLYAKEQAYFMNADELILCNDSCYGPFFPLQEMFNSMSKYICDVWGVTCNISGYAKTNYKYEIINGTPHIQTFFCVINKKVMQAEFFDLFLKSVKAEENKYDVIINYEMGFSRLLHENDMVIRSYVEGYTIDASMWGEHVPRKPLRALAWMKQYRVPFLKCYYSPCSFNEYNSVSLYPAQLIYSHLKRKRGKFWFYKRLAKHYVKRFMIGW